MKILNSQKEFSKIDSSKKIALSIGNFDGVHLGHRSLFEKIKKDNYDIGVMSFIPHPFMFFNKIIADYKLTTEDEKTSIFESLGINYYFRINFNDEIKDLHYSQFIEKYLVKIPNIEKIYVGEDFKFGKNRQGNIENLTQELKKHRISVEILPKRSVNQEKISSTLIRKKIKNQKIENLKNYLGNHYSLGGKVIPGSSRGRLLGFRTANLAYPLEKIIPPVGVYLTKSRVKEQYYYSLTNIGHRPTFDSGKEITVETFLYNFEKDIYDQEIKIFFYKYLRPEIKFSHQELLIAQIKKDIISMRQYFEI